MNPPPQPKITHSYITDPKGSKVRVTRLQQDVDSTHVVIESTTPASSSRHHNPSKSQDKTKYYIEIDDEDDSNIDVVVNVSQSPQIRSNRRYQTSATEINAKQDNTSNHAANSRIRIESNPGQDYEYEINYSTHNQNNHNNQNNQDKRNSKSGSSGLERNYQTCITQTHHTIKIRNNNGLTPSYYHHHPAHHSHIHRQRGFNDAQNYSEASYPVPKPREEKTFGIHNMDARNSEGRIIKNGQSNKNISESRKNQNEKATKIDTGNAEETRVAQTPRRKKQEQSFISIQDHNQSMQKIQLLNSQGQGSKMQTNRYTIDRSDKKTDLANTRQFRTEPRTPKSNYENASDQSLSPIVQEYGTNYEFNQMNEHPQKIFLEKHPYRAGTISLPREDSLDKQRVPPVPYEKLTLQKKIQKQIANEWPPSLKDIPIGNSPKGKKNTMGSNTSRNEINRSKDSPIRVPFQKLPSSPEKKNSMDASVMSASQQIKRVKIFLNSRPHQGHIHKQIVHPTQKNQKNDLFVINKQKYLEKLRKSERSKSKLENSRTFSRNSRHSLSPECAQITNRLHTTRTNKQPCPKYVHYKELMKRAEMKETLGEYSFIRRYLTDTEIGEILTQLELQGVPQKKWPMRLVDIVYDKLRAMKVC